MATNKDFVVKNGLQVGANTSIEGSITTVDSVQFDLTAAIDPFAEGQLAWNADHGTLTLGIDGSDIDLHIGEDSIIKVKAAVAITRGDLVYASGAVGASGNIEVSPYLADSSINQNRIIGIAGNTIAQGDFGYVVKEGEIRKIDASGALTTGGETWNDGDILYASATNAGELTKTAPTAPNQSIAVAFVVSNNSTSGILQVRVTQLGFNLGELHDVNISSVANNQILTYDAVNSRWNNSDDLNLPGDLTVAGNFTVSGNTTLVNSNNLAIEDLNIVLANGAANSSVADGAGITIDGANAQITYDGTNNEWDFNTNITVTSQSNEAYIDLYDSGGSHSQIGGGTYGAYGNSKISFRTQEDSGSLTTKMVIIDDGKVGIGALNPTEKLHLSGGKLLINNGGSLYIDSDASQAVLATTGNRLLKFETNSTNRLVISGSTGDATFSANVSAANMSATTIGATTLNATTINGAFGNTALTIASSYSNPSTGNIWFDSLNLKLKVYDGNNWLDAMPTAGGGTSNTATTDANATFAKYTYVLGSDSSVVSGADVANNTLSYDTSGIENVEVFVNGVKQVEGASYDYTATTGVSVGFTSTLSAGDVVDIQVYELLTNDAFYLKTETYTQTEVNSQITTALGDYVPKTGGSFTGIVGGGTSSNVAKNIADTNLPIQISTAADNSSQVYFAANRNGTYGALFGYDNNGFGGVTIRNVVTANTSNSGSDRISFVVNNTSEAMTIAGNTNIGIATSNPANPLHVVGTRPLRVERSGVGAYEISVDNTISGDTVDYVIEPKQANSGVQFRTANASGTLIEAVNINRNGVVGIGTDSPLTKLTVSTTGADGITLAQDTGAPTASARMFFASSSGNWAILNSVGEFMFASGGTPGADTGNSRVRITTTGTIYPDGATADLGSTTNPWQNIYTQDLVLSNESRATGNDIDGTKGNWTVQEGEDHLYLINNKNGKKYRFALEEIE